MCSVISHDPQIHHSETRRRTPPYVRNPLPPSGFLNFCLLPLLSSHSSSPPPPHPGSIEERSSSLKGKMKGSPIFPRDESGGCHESEYDLREDFSKFLEEARKSVGEGALEPESLSSLFSPEKKNTKKTEAEDRRSRRTSWKNSLLFWRRFEKKGSSPALANRSAMNHGNVATQLVSRPRLQGGAASGPMPGGRSKHHIRRSGRLRPASGPLSGCFTPTRADEEAAEVPYMCLGQLGTPSRNQDFGPIYRVT